MRLNRPLGIAVFGCGRMGMNHVHAIRKEKLAELKAVADLAINEHGLRNRLPADVRVYSNPEDLLKDVRPDVVHICTPVETHVELAKLSIAHGAHIYVEKPFVINALEARTILSLAEEQRVKVCAGYQLLCESPSLKAKELLERIGRIVHIESYFSFRPVRRRVTPVEQLIDILPHPVYLLLNFMHPGGNSKVDSRVEIKHIEADPDGEVRCVMKLSDITAILIVTFHGRPVESYLRIVGTNGSLHADFVLGTLTKLLGPGASAPSVIMNPYSEARQIAWETSRSIVRLVFSRQKSYPGLLELIHAFYSSILKGSSPPLSYDSILETVGVCETISKQLRQAEAESEEKAHVELDKQEIDLPSLEPEKPLVLVTGANGFLGRVVVSDLRLEGWPVRALVRTVPRYTARVPGVEYVSADLGEPLSSELLREIRTIVHCAAETSGGKEAHEKNTIVATENLLDAAAKAGVKRFIHISSLAVLKSAKKSEPISEQTPREEDLGRGPYVWAKARSERIAIEKGKELGLNVKVIRPGPLVDLTAFEAPGRLGREVGSLFVAIGGRRNKLSLCEVNTAAEVVRAYVDDFDAAPPILNLIEPNAPTRAELVARLLRGRPDLKAFWVPPITLKVMSPLLKAFQRFLLPGKRPIDIRDTFSSENYKTDLAETIIKKVHQHSTSIKK